MKILPARVSRTSALLCLLSTALTGCGRSQSADNAPNTPAANTVAAPDAKSTAKPGFVSGKITNADGSPITVPGVTFTVFITGISGHGEPVSFTPAVAADGTYSLAVPSGVYHPTQGSLHVSFDGELYIYNLVQTTMVNDVPSDPGIVSDFVWQISGPTPIYKDRPDPGNLGSWFGACMDADWAPTYTDTAGQLHNLIVPPGTKFIFTATPNGKLIDGTDGKTTTITRSFAPDSLGPPNLNDLPPALNGWHITGVENRPDGTTVPLQLKKTIDPNYASSVDVKIRPDGYTGVTGWPIAVTQSPP